MVSLGDTLHGALVSTADRLGGEREAVRDSERQLSLEALTLQSQRLAGAFMAHGVSRGDRIMIVSSNRAEFVVSHFAALFAGAISVPVDHAAGVAAVTFILAATSPRILVINSGALVTLRSQGIRLPPIVVEIADGNSRTNLEVGSAESFEDLVANGRRIFLDNNPEHSTILYTTGSSGRPKGVLLSHAATLHTVASVIDFISYSSSDREVISIPVTHSFGLGHVYCNLFSGGAVYLQNGLANVKRVLSAVQEWGATGFPGTPLGFGLLLDNYSGAFEKYAAGLRFVVVNSAPLSSERASQLQATLPRTELFVYYGLTEASRSTYISLSKAGQSRYTSVGKPMRGVDIKLVGNPPEIVVRGPHLASGYWMDEELTSKAFSASGLKTGDVGELDADGFLYITGRLSDLINLGGYKVDPVEVETWLKELPEVADAGVTAIESSIAAEDVELVALVVMKTGERFDEAELASLARISLEPFKIPRRWVHVSILPRSATGKMLRAELKDLAANYRQER
ncbi:MAG: acyl--CoA ligase [Gammaproteobacteria bacterium]|nr:acyl--CoA ligase [Gammaproteobacteria bacterium]